MQLDSIKSRVISALATRISDAGLNDCYQLNLRRYSKGLAGGLSEEQLCALAAGAAERAAGAAWDALGMRR